MGADSARTILRMSAWSPQSLTPQVLLRASIAVATVTIALKFLAWWLTDSVGLLSDAMESIVNLASAAFALLMVRIAQRPADASHPYGHTKAEYFSAGFEGMMIIVAALGIMWAALLRFNNPQGLQQVGIGHSDQGTTAFRSIRNAKLAGSEASTSS